MYYLNLPKDIYISDTQPDSNYKYSFWLKTVPTEVFDIKGPRLLDKQASAEHFNINFCGNEALKVFKFDTAPELMILDELSQVWTSYRCTSTGDFVQSCLSFKISNNKVHITACDPAYAGRVVIPAKIDNLPVTTIDRLAFNKCKKISELILPEGLETLQPLAFYQCSISNKVILPDTLINLYGEAFYCCSTKAFTSFDGCYYIGTKSNPYKYCIGNACLDDNEHNSSITIHTATEEICSSAFANDYYLEEINIPGNVKRVGDQAFYGCEGLATVNLATGVQSLGYSCFYYCPNLCSIVLPDSLVNVGSECFADCGSLTSVKLSAGLSYIAGSMFEYCYSLTTINIPNTITEIHEYAFASSGITKLTIPDSVTVLDYEFLYDCSGVSLHLGAGIREIDNEILSNCSLASFSISTENPYLFFNEADNTVYSKDMTKIYCVIGNISEYYILDTITEIGRYAFYGMTDLTNVSGGSGLVRIGVSAFAYCTCLESIGLVNSLKYIESNAFESSGLESVALPDSLVSLGEYAFAYTPITSISFGTGLTAIPNDCFSSCTYLDNVVIPNNIVEIGDHAFINCESLNNITISDNVTFIASSVFIGVPLNGSLIEGDYGLYIGSKKNPYMFLYEAWSASALLPETKTIGQYAFADTSISKITIPETIMSIGSNTFTNCKSLTEVIFRCSQKALGGSTFSNCTSLVSVTLPSDLEYLYYDVFRGCTKLRGVILPSSLKSIASTVFYGCKALTEIILPAGLRSISSGIFSGCDNLTKIYAQFSSTATVASSAPWGARNATIYYNY